MIRKANINDLSIIESLAINYDKDFNNHYDLKSYLNDDLYIINVYEEDNIIKGFIICNNLYDDIEILLIYVDEKYRRCNIATMLINNLSTYNKKRILLEVSTENTNAYNLYTKLGFKTINIRKGYYHGIDAKVMEKVIE